MSDAERATIQQLVRNRADIKRTVEQRADGVTTTTVTQKPELVSALRTHVKQMSERLDTNRPVRLWDPAFRDVFTHADEIEIKLEEIDGGIRVTETAKSAEAIRAIQAHARKVSGFVADGPTATQPPWAQGRGRARR